MDSVTIFGITFNIDPVAFSLFGKWHIYWYGILIALGVCLAVVYGLKNGDRFGIKNDHIIDSFLVVLPVSILCARAYYILFDPSGQSSFAKFFDFSDGNGFTGLAIYGGVIGAAISIIIMQRIYKFSLLAALDITSVGFLIGQGIGRWGNFINQEAYGTFTGSDWFGMTGTRIASEVGSDALVHPCFLYESIWCLAGFFVLHALSKRRKYKGQIALMYGVWYGFERTFIELLRTDSLMIGNIRVSSLLSALLCVCCATVLILLHRRGVGQPPEQYQPQFAAVGEMAMETEEAILQPADAIETAAESAEPVTEVNQTSGGENHADH